MKKKIFTLLGLVLVAVCLIGCGPKEDPSTGNPTVDAIQKAQAMTLEELEAASKAEMEGATTPFKVVGLTSVLQKAAKTFASKYEWINYVDGKTAGENVNVKNDYKDYALLQALEVADTGYFADFALVQDVRSIAGYDGELLHNYIPSDIDTLGVVAGERQPLAGIAFNKLFWTNKNFETVRGFKLYNIWQLTGLPELDDKGEFKKFGKTDKTDYCPYISFQSPATEQINMSFLLSCYAEENQARIKDAYKAYYGKDWVETDNYKSAGEQWVKEFVKSITRWHSSDGTAMKETQLKDDWNKGYVYYGAFAKMKDAVGKYYAIAGQDTDPILKDLVITSGDNAGKICAMDTVKWDWEIKGFNGFYYNMCSQICNNAKYPYTACLFARNLLTLEAYEGGVYNKDLPKPTGVSKVNQYGYYFPASNDITYAVGDWKRDVHKANEIVEDYAYLKTVRVSKVNEILAIMK